MQGSARLDKYVHTPRFAVPFGTYHSNVCFCRTSSALAETQRVLAETEEVGQATMNDMYTQREQLLNAHGNVSSRL
jgi:hypothetical protein